MQKAKVIKTFFDELSKDERILDPESYFKINVTIGVWTYQFQKQSKDFKTFLVCSK